MKMLPGMTVINPCDYHQTKAATIAIAEHEGPVYLRFGRPKVPIFVADDAEFVIGKADTIFEGKDVSIIACGHMVYKAIEAAQELAKEGIDAEVINMHTIKPLDEKAILATAQKTGCVVTAEEHMINGGLGDSVAQVLSRNNPTPQEYVGVNDTFGESATPDELMKKYNIDTADVIKAVKKVIARKK
jgi:transketolase